MTNNQIQQNPLQIEIRLVDRSNYCVNICGGYCCMNLTLPYSPEELKFIKAVDIEFPSNIFVFKEKIIVNGEERYRYYCKLCNDGTCSDYESRPDMCRGFGTDYKAEDAVFCIYSNKFDKDYLNSTERLAFKA